MNGFWLWVAQGAVCAAAVVCGATWHLLTMGFCAVIATVLGVEKYGGEGCMGKESGR